MRARILKGSFALGITIAMTTGLGSAATAAEDDDVSLGISRLDAVIKCVPIETSFFCTDIGFAPADEDFASWKAALRSAVAGDAIASGDEGLAATIERLEALSTAELKSSQELQIADARVAAAKVELVEALSDGEAPEAGFFKKHPQLNIGEASALATMLRSQAKAQGLLDRGIEAHGGPGSSFLGGLAHSRLALAVPYPSEKVIMRNKQKNQTKDYYCGPATMQTIDWGDPDDDGLDSQDLWADEMGTTTAGTSISALTREVNESTHFDDMASDYAPVSTVGKDAQWLENVFKYNIGLKSAPVVLHPKLLKKYFTYLNYDHGGHFQTGVGYNSNNKTITFLEPYNERDFRGTSGAVSGGTHVMSIQTVLNAQNANTNRNIGY